MKKKLISYFICLSVFLSSNSIIFAQENGTTGKTTNQSNKTQNSSTTTTTKSTNNNTNNNNTSNKKDTNTPVNTTNKKVPKKVNTDDSDSANKVNESKQVDNSNKVDLMSLNKDDFVNNISTDSFVVIDASSGQMLLNKNENKKMYPASLTKLLTALLLLENKKMTDMLTASKEASKVGESSINVKEGEKISTKDILYSMMLQSANDASFVAAENISGDTTKFATLMNKRAKELGASNSNFITPNGLHDVNHVTTAMDLALISKQALTHKEFLDCIKTKDYSLDRADSSSNMDLQNKNRMIFDNKKEYNKYCIGGKTGYTTQAGNCLMEVAQNGNLQVIVITLKSNKIYDDTKNIIDYVFKNFTTKSLVSKDNISGKIGNTDILMHMNKDITYSVFNNESMDNLSVKKDIAIDKNIALPIKRDQKIGEMTVSINGKQYSKENLYASSDFDSATMPKIKTNHYFRNIFILIAFVVLIKCILIYKNKRKNDDRLNKANIY